MQFKVIVLLAEHILALGGQRWEELLAEARISTYLQDRNTIVVGIPEVRACLLYTSRCV